jgi:hypothetical protein
METGNETARVRRGKEEEEKRKKKGKRELERDGEIAWERRKHRERW